MGNNALRANASNIMFHSFPILSMLVFQAGSRVTIVGAIRESSSCLRGFVLQ